MSTNAVSSISVRSDKVTVPSVTDLVCGDVPQLQAWMASKHFAADKLLSVLTVAASNGRADICLTIIDSGRLSISIDQLGWILQAACCYNQLTVAKIIVKRFQTSLSSHHFHHSLLEASMNGHSDVVQWLLSEMKLSHDDSVTWMLATASARGDIDTVKLLTAQTASQAIHNASHALRTACYNGRTDIVDWLMANTASSVSKLGDLGTHSGGKMTSLTAACNKRHADLVRILLQCVTPHTVNIQCGTYKNSALHFVIWHGRNQGVNSLHEACNNNNINEVKTLVHTNDDDVNVQDNDGDTPLHKACQLGNVDIVECLLSVFANTNITNVFKRTPVEHAKHFGNNEVVSCFTCFSQPFSWPADVNTHVTTSVSVTQSTPGIVSITDATTSDDTTAHVTTSVSVTQSTSGIASITDVTISDVHSRKQHERVSVPNTVKQRHKTYV